MCVRECSYASWVNPSPLLKSLSFLQPVISLFPSLSLSLSLLCFFSLDLGHERRREHLTAVPPAAGLSTKAHHNNITKLKRPYVTACCIHGIMCVLLSLDDEPGHKSSVFWIGGVSKWLRPTSSLCQFSSLYSWNTQSQVFVTLSSNGPMCNIPLFTNTICPWLASELLQVIKINDTN